MESRLMARYCAFDPSGSTGFVVVSTMFRSIDPPAQHTYEHKMVQKETEKSDKLTLRKKRRATC